MWLFHDAKYAFIAMRRKAYVVSAAALALGIGAMMFNIFTIGRWQQYGVDFDGGVLVQVSFSQPLDDSDLRAALGGASAPPITRFGGDNEFVIRAPLEEERDIDEVAGDVEVQLAASFGESSFEVVRQESVGPKIGRELEQRAALAILFSLALTLIYIAIRFEVRFGLAAVIATAHDMLIVLGLLALFRVEIALPTVAAILTILGYSLNDTIVVFDRIRENLNAKGGRREDPYRLVNRSINETLPRTVLTSGTTLAVLFSLLALGGAVIRDFTIVLILGVMIGTYSSIFIASPALLEIQKRFGTGDARKKQQGRRVAAAV
ncbi:MAG: protein translocase subunit SecF [Gemmatimonadetes bacterium]|nr:protein translocase subunit SecF [Gemmatimonadota bacterium]MDE2678089.1 protein translocase subunit SecF [Gemmatimonadota bacterium]MXX35368.1 protein translocase subunit SecF [Gemmatimonadota bacterium]MYA10309.1 protein translocase subunit SecF [Gemmatimonadota bacterium]MYD12040.1 protein translocase subunit SecF [Gemmatimonadota bacterium]